MNLIAAWPRMLPPELAQEYVGGPTMLGLLLEKKLVRAKVRRRKGLTLYDRHELDAACDALKDE